MVVLVTIKITYPRFRHTIFYEFVRKITIKQKSQIEGKNEEGYNNNEKEKIEQKKIT